MTVRYAQPQDFDSIVSLINSLSLNAKFNWNQENLYSELKMATTIVVEEKKLIEAFLSFRSGPDFNEITVLATAIKSQKKGFQTQLLHHLQIKSREAKKYILLEVHALNLSAIELYRKNHFIEIAARKNYYKDGASALIFRFDG